MKEIKIIGSALPNIPWEDRPESSSVPLWRYSQNPIIKRNQLPDSNSIFNSAVIKFKDGFAGCLLYTSTSPRDTERSRMPSSA